MSQLPRWVSERSLIAITLLVVPVGLLSSTQGLKFADLGGAFSPVFFPSIALWLWIGLAAINLLSVTVSSAPQQAVPLWRVAFVGFGFVVYALIVVPLGFLLSSTLFCIMCLLSLGIRKVTVVAGFSIALPASLYIVFNVILKLPLPHSPWTHWF